MKLTGDSKPGDRKLGAGKAAAKDDGGWAETAKIVVHALLLALVVRVFFYQPFNIPSGSMKSTLLVGDYLFVSKLSYGYSRYSFPFGIPVFSGRWFGAEPKRGDVAVFKLPRDNSTDYIKRVIGLPGDEIRVVKGILFINDKEVVRRPVGMFSDIDEGGIARQIPMFEETLPNGVKYKVLDEGPDFSLDTVGPFKVPAGRFFMMGDNRDNSTDSRDRWVGYVPYENFVGRAEILFYSSDPSCSYAPDSIWPVQQLKVLLCASSVGIRFGRLFNLVR